MVDCLEKGSEMDEMNGKPPDRRVQRTRKLLQDALVELILEKGYEAITVQDVIDRANVGRSTFYTHFQDTEMLFFSTFEWLWREFENHLPKYPTGGPQSPWELTLLLFQHVQSHSRLYKALMGERAGTTAIAKNHLIMKMHVQEHLATYAPRAHPLMVDLLAHYSITGLVSLLTWWLDHDLPFSAEQMNTTYQRLLQPGVESILEPLWKQP